MRELNISEIHLVSGGNPYAQIAQLAGKGAKLARQNWPRIKQGAIDFAEGFATAAAGDYAYDGVYNGGGVVGAGIGSAIAGQKGGPAKKIVGAMIGSRAEGAVKDAVDRSGNNYGH